MHIITGEIRKEPFVKQTQGGTLYIVELSERYKDKDKNWQYTNYKFFFNAKSEALDGWYRDAFQQGKVISVSCETLRADVSEYNGTQYITLMPGDFPKLLFSQRVAAQENANYQANMNQFHQQAKQQAPQQQYQQAPQQQSQNHPPMDFDDDIPF